MSDIAVTVENLSKSYLVGHQAAERERYTALRDVIGRELRGMGRRAVALVRGRQIVEGDNVEEFWALNGVSFEIQRGEVIGIIGRNGAGKSTLLKILSRITEPTAGRAILRGRIASLLEVGTGFHPELTGRENIFLNGAVLGMKRAEVRRKFDEIVAFAEIEAFLDTPVKRYSSGMYTRLAFAVAAHLEPEILIVDEVLAVGDAEFQKKCLGKMNEVSRGGRTVIFVSHSMSAIVTLCSSALWLHNGGVAKIGNTAEVCAAYSSFKTTPEYTAKSSILKNIFILGRDDYSVASVTEGENLKFRLSVRLPEEKCMLSLILKDSRNSVLLELFDHSFSPSPYDGSDATVEVQADSIPLLPGAYSVDFWFGNRVGQVLERINNAVEFEIAAGIIKETTFVSSGSLSYQSRWRSLKVPAATMEVLPAQ